MAAGDQSSSSSALSALTVTRGSEAMYNLEEPLSKDGNKRVGIRSRLWKKLSFFVNVYVH